jgi:uncharacterized tellurite resistance protein B-like protein
MPVPVQGEITLPTNPNGVVFAADARDVLAGRSWREVQRISVRCLERFNRASGLSALVKCSWRVAVDRRNNRSPQFLMVYVIDGPASAADIRILEEEMRGSAVVWSESQVERLPPNAVLSLMIANGQLHQLWEEAAGSAMVRKLVLGERGVGIVELSAREVEPTDFIDGARHVFATHPRYEDHDAELERMRLVFARHYAQRIVEADGKVLEEEVVFMDTVFPGHLMRRLSLVDPSQAKKYFEQSIKRLPDALGHHDKLALIGLFFSACYSDGSLDAREIRVLRQAGEALGLTRHEVVDYLERFW